MHPVVVPSASKGHSNMLHHLYSPRNLDVDILTLPHNTTSDTCLTPVSACTHLQGPPRRVVPSCCSRMAALSSSAFTDFVLWMKSHHHILHIVHGFHSHHRSYMMRGDTAREVGRLSARKGGK